MAKEKTISTLVSETGKMGSAIQSVNGKKKITGVISGKVTTIESVQPKYGVTIGSASPLAYVQPDYGVHIEPGMQPKYGVILPSTPIYSPTIPVSGKVDIDITYNELEANISLLKKSIANIKSSWEGETKRNLATLNDSWVGQDCSAYTSKLSAMDDKVQHTVSALELLCSTYEKARDMIRDNQNQVASSINNMN